MKKLISLLLILTIFILFSCNKKPDSDNDSTTTQTSQEGVYDDSLPWGSLH